MTTMMMIFLTLLQAFIYKQATALCKVCVYTNTYFEFNVEASMRSRFMEIWWSLNLIELALDGIFDSISLFHVGRWISLHLFCFTKILAKLSQMLYKFWIFPRKTLQDKHVVRTHLPWHFCRKPLKLIKLCVNWSMHPHLHPLELLNLITT